VTPTWVVVPLLAGLLHVGTARAAVPRDPAEQAYQAARTGYYALKADAKRRKLRDSWLVVARRFETVAKTYPKSPRAPDALFTAAQMLGDLSRISGASDDTTASVEDYKLLLDAYPKHRLADDAALALAHTYLDRLNQPEAARRVLQRGLLLPKGDQHAKLQSLLASVRAEAPETPARRAEAERPALSIHTQPPPPPAETPAWLKAVTRKPRTSERRPASPTNSAPAEPGSTSDAPEPAETPPGDADAPAARVAGPAEPLTEEVPRVRGVPDAGPLLAAAPRTEVRDRLRAMGKQPRGGEVTLAEQLGLKVRRVVIDPGHGGHDTGTVGADGTKEKDVALAISRRLRTILTEQGLEVTLTRESDRFVRLEDRARMANIARADLFISVHCNSLPQKSIRGIETYTLNLASDRYAIRLAARENATSEKGLSDLQFLLADLATRANTEESVRLASRVQAGLVSRLTSKERKIHDLGTKEALFYVLLGTKMPAILVEAGFLSNAEEEKRLSTPAYQDEVARALAAGVQDFLGNRDRLAKVN
jgi:N-acetylmuramoyl-L-alanine amidase